MPGFHARQAQRAKAREEEKKEEASRVEVLEARVQKLEWEAKEAEHVHEHLVAEFEDNDRAEAVQDVWDVLSGTKLEEEVNLHDTPELVASFFAYRAGAQNTDKRLTEFASKMYEENPFRHHNIVFDWSTRYMALNKEKKQEKKED